MTRQLDDKLVSKVADFGLARELSGEGSYNTTKTGLGPIRWMR